MKKSLLAIALAVAVSPFVLAAQTPASSQSSSSTTTTTKTKKTKKVKKPKAKKGADANTTTPQK